MKIMVARVYISFNQCYYIATGKIVEKTGFLSLVDRQTHLGEGKTLISKPGAV